MDSCILVSVSQIEDNTQYIIVAQKQQRMAPYLIKDESLVKRLKTNFLKQFSNKVHPLK
jgi:hypothetical protein